MRGSVEVVVGLLVLVAAQVHGADVVEADALVFEVLEVREDGECLVVVEQSLRFLAVLVRLAGNLNGLGHVVESYLQVVQFSGGLLEAERGGLVRAVRNEDVDGLVQPHNLEGDLARQFSEIEVGSCDEHPSEDD